MFAQQRELRATIAALNAEIESQGWHCGGRRWYRWDAQASHRGQRCAACGPVFGSFPL